MSLRLPDLPDEPSFYEQTWDLAYRHALGDTVGTYFAALKEKRLLGRACGECKRVLFPARSFCDRCHAATQDWVEVSPLATLEMFTIVTEPFPGMLVEPPYVLAYARPDGADTAAVGYVHGVDLSSVRRAAERLNRTDRVTIRFVDRPEGRATDIWFDTQDG